MAILTMEDLKKDLRYIDKIVHGAEELINDVVPKCSIQFRVRRIEPIVFSIESTEFVRAICDATDLGMTWVASFNIPIDMILMKINGEDIPLKMYKRISHDNAYS